LAGAAIPGLLLISLLPTFGEDSPAFLWGYFVALAFGVLVVQYAITRPAWLEMQWVVAVGAVSYGIYLWHYAFLGVDLPMWAAVVGTAVATIGSWNLVEKPVLRWASSVTGTAVSKTGIPFHIHHETFMKELSGTVPVTRSLERTQP
jgi:peptidoglycan/LPS O-acetylase OafA/YrhL